MVGVWRGVKRTGPRGRDRRSLLDAGRGGRSRSRVKLRGDGKRDLKISRSESSPKLYSWV